MLSALPRKGSAAITARDADGPPSQPTTPSAGEPRGRLCPQQNGAAGAREDIDEGLAQFDRVGAADNTESDQIGEFGRMRNRTKEEPLRAPERARYGVGFLRVRDEPPGLRGCGVQRIMRALLRRLRNSFRRVDDILHDLGRNGNADERHCKAGIGMDEYRPTWALNGAAAAKAVARTTSSRSEPVRGARNLCKAHARSSRHPRRRA